MRPVEETDGQLACRKPRAAGKAVDVYSGIARCFMPTMRILEYPITKSVGEEAGHELRPNRPAEGSHDCRACTCSKAKRLRPIARSAPSCSSLQELRCLRPPQQKGAKRGQQEKSKKEKRISSEGIGQDGQTDIQFHLFYHRRGAAHLRSVCLQLNSTSIPLSPLLLPLLFLLIAFAFLHGALYLASIATRCVHLPRRGRGHSRALVFEAKTVVTGSTHSIDPPAHRQPIFNPSNHSSLQLVPSAPPGLSRARLMRVSPRRRRQTPRDKHTHNHCVTEISTHGYNHSQVLPGQPSNHQSLPDELESCCPSILPGLPRRRPLLHAIQLLLFSLVCVAAFLLRFLSLRLRDNTQLTPHLRGLNRHCVVNHELATLTPTHTSRAGRPLLRPACLHTVSAYLVPPHLSSLVSKPVLSIARTGPLPHPRCHVHIK